MPNIPAQSRRRFLTVFFTLLITAFCIVFLFFVNRFQLVITPIGPTVLEVQPRSEYQDTGATAALHGSILFRSGLPVPAEIRTEGTVDTHVSGIHELRYYGKFLFWDALGFRSIHVVDKLPPQITLQFLPGSFTIPGENYQEEGFSAYDELDGDLTNHVLVMEAEGFVHYTVKDRAGNEARVSRKIYYQDPIPPEITLLGETEIHIPAGFPFEDPGAAAEDNCDGNVSDTLRIEGNLDTYLAGTYQLNYFAADHSGNEAQATRTVIVEPAQFPAIVDPGKKVIYLTFDDGPCYYTPRLLDILAKYNAKATFFVVKSDYLYLCQRMVDEGHAVGIHTVTHNYREIYSSADAFFQDLLTMQELIYQNCGVRTYLMRFPGGSSNTVSAFNPGIMSYLTQAVEDCGFRYFDWNVDSNDAGGAKKSKEVYDNVIKGIRYRQISVVLQHDNKDFSVAAVEKILAWGTANGYRFLALDMTSPDNKHAVNN